MPARDGRAGGLGHAAPARKNGADRLIGNLADGHADNGETKDGFRPHREDIRQGIGCGDAPECMRVVDDGGEEVGRGNERGCLVDEVDGRIIALARVHNQV